MKRYFIPDSFNNCSWELRIKDSNRLLPNLKIIHLKTTAVPLNRQERTLQRTLNCGLSVPLEKAE